MNWRERDGARWLEADLGGGRVAFSTRLGGFSEPPFDSLNLGILTEDEPGAVTENRRCLAAALNLEPGQLAFARQVHGKRLIDHSDPAGEELPEADGHVLREPGAAAMVLAADCLPVALRGPGGLAMVHAGWRGLAAGILAGAAEAVEANSAAIGPGIGPCCYEVGEEVAGAFTDLGEGVAHERMLDLPEVARRRLAEAGVDRIESAGLCTSCEPGLFFSHRRDHGRTGRQAGIAWLES
jgi:YfiH family protein